MQTLLIYKLHIAVKLGHGSIFQWKLVVVKAFSSGLQPEMSARMLTRFLIDLVFPITSLFQTVHLEVVCDCES